MDIMKLPGGTTQNLMISLNKWVMRLLSKVLLSIATLKLQPNKEYNYSFSAIYNFIKK